MSPTRKLLQLSMPRLAHQSTNLVILFAFVHTVSDAVTNMLSALLPTMLVGSVPLYCIFILTPDTFVDFVAVAQAGALINAGMPMLIVSAQDLSPATAFSMMMAFSAGVAGLVYVFMGRLQQSMGLAPAMAIDYVSLFVAAVLGMVAIKPQPSPEETPVEKLSCLCSPCIEQNVRMYPQRRSRI